MTARADGRVLLAVRELDLHPGERVAVVGTSGAGKSLLLATLMGRWPGTVRFEGRREASATRVGVVPQRGLDALHPLIPLERQLARVARTPRRRVARVLTAVGLGDHSVRRRRPTELSGGQAQRAAVALTVLAGAPLLLADEPTSALDHDSRDELLDLLGSVLGPTQALVVTSHDPDVATRLATRRIVLADGTVVADEPLRRDPAVSVPRGAVA